MGCVTGDCFLFKLTRLSTGKELEAGVKVGIYADDADDQLLMLLPSDLVLQVGPNAGSQIVL